MAAILKHEFQGSFSITMDCETPSDDVVQDAGHEPNGYFWEGVAQLLLSTERPELADKIDFDSEGSMFCAVGDDPKALEVLAALMTPVVNDPARTRIVIVTAAEVGFEFDD